jgi:hypothetical protein
MPSAGTPCLRYRGANGRATFPAGDQPVVPICLPAGQLFSVSVRRHSGVRADDRNGEAFLLRTHSAHLNPPGQFDD